MKSKTSTVTLYEFEGYLLLALDSAWKNVLGELVTLDVSIDNQGSYTLYLTRIDKKR